MEGFDAGKGKDNQTLTETCWDLDLRGTITQTLHSSDVIAHCSDVHAQWHEVHSKREKKMCSPDAFYMTLRQAFLAQFRKKKRFLVLKISKLTIKNCHPLQKNGIHVHVFHVTTWIMCGMESCWPFCGVMWPDTKHTNCYNPIIDYWPIYTVAVFRVVERVHNKFIPITTYFIAVISCSCTSFFFSPSVL